MKNSLFLLLILLSTFQMKAQPGNCILKKPSVSIHFGTGNVRDVNTEMTNYWRVSSSCPTDGHYSYTSFTDACFRGDWHTIREDHTPGDAGGNMMLINASPASGTFLTTTVNGLKGGATYEFAVWMMNVCRITEKCPYPLLPNISILLQTTTGKFVARFSTGDLLRRRTPYWTPYRAFFNMPASLTSLKLVMINHSPGGCGNDFVLDDITFRECEKPVPAITKVPKTSRPPNRTTYKPVTNQQPKPLKPVVKKSVPVKKSPAPVPVKRLQPDSLPQTISVAKKRQPAITKIPAVLLTRTNPVIKKIELPACEITIDLYDNGQVDGDTVSIYHNNKMVVSHARLSQKPITFQVSINPEQPHHELVMVAENLGSIPPNTSLMILTAGTKRYEVFISSTEQKNAKIILALEP